MEDSYENYKRSTGGNTLGIVGFILSLLCITAVIGLPLSLIALRRQPRGLAIAGTVIGLIFLGLQVVGGVSFYNKMSESNFGSFANFLEYTTDLSKVASAAEKYKEENGAYPDSLADLVLDDDAKTDPWGNSYRLEQIVGVGGNQIVLRTAGEDGLWDTEDDPMPNSKPKEIDQPAPKKADKKVEPKTDEDK